MMVIKCPHCEEYIEIESINCGIFGHGQYRTNGQQLPPHSPKELCDKVYQENLIYGCGKPFRVHITDNTPDVTICEYI